LHIISKKYNYFNPASCHFSKYKGHINGTYRKTLMFSAVDLLTLTLQWLRKN
jgi:hypothetical protein